MAPHDLADVFRQLHGYGVAEYSLRLKRHDEFTDWRFDHVFGSAALYPVTCRYVHAWQESGLSEHSTWVVEFEPQFGRSRSVESSP